MANNKGIGLRIWHANTSKRTFLILEEQSSSGGGGGASAGIDSLSAVAPIAYSFNPATQTGVITTSMNTNRLIGRYSAGVGVMQEVSLDPITLSLSALGVLSATASGGTAEVFQVPLTKGALNVYTGTTSNTMTAYSVNSIFLFSFDVVPSGGTAITANINGLGAVTLKKPNTVTNLPSNALTQAAPTVYEFAYTAGVFVPESKILIREASGIPINFLLDATDTNTIDNTDFAQEWQWSSLTTNTALKLSSTSIAGNASKLLQLTRSGANNAVSRTNYGLFSEITNTGSTSVNIGIYSSASGATTNYGLVVDGNSFIAGNTSSGGAMTLTSTTHATKGKIYFGSGQINYYDELNKIIYVNTGAISYAFLAESSAGIQVGFFAGATTGQFGTKTNHDLQLFTNNSGTEANLITWTTSGNMGVGANTPATKLDVRGGIKGNAGCSIGSGTTPSTGIITSGKVGIQTASQTYPLNVVGSANDYFGFFDTGGGVNGGCYIGTFFNWGSKSATSLGFFTGDGTIQMGLTVTNGNLVLGSSTLAQATSATKSLHIYNGTEASAAATAGIVIGSQNTSDAASSLYLRTEQTVVSEVVVSDRTLKVRINGTEYKICLKA